MSLVLWDKEGKGWMSGTRDGGAGGFVQSQVDEVGGGSGLVRSAVRRSSRVAVSLRAGRYGA